ncbi:MAG: N-acetylneuraminate synthase family protein [Flavobacteriales bacterium]|nr:N-acetylneuraminate synthase family protein [Flavobacteriales bacterium]
MSKRFLIAEVGQAHDGSLGILHSYIDAVSKTGVDAIKFQTHIAEAESSLDEPFRVKFSYEDKTRFDYWKRMSFSKQQWIEIKMHCEEVGLEFISSPFSIAAVDLLEELGVKRYKIGSGETSNLLMLEEIAKTGKPIILSSGMSSYDELQATVDFLKPFGNELTILQCTTAYPTSAENVGLNVITELKSKFKELKIGFSDHSGLIYPCIAAATLGAEVLEFHVVFDQRMFGPDAKSSLSIDEVSELVKGVRFIETAVNNPVNKNDLTPYVELKNIFEKSLAVNKKLAKGHCLTKADLEAKKPSGKGIAARDFNKVIGMQLQEEKEAYSFLNLSDLIGGNE